MGTRRHRIRGVHFFRLCVTDGEAVCVDGGGGLGIKATHIARTWIVLSVTGFFSYLDAVFRYSIAWIYFLSACSTLPAAEQNDGER